MAALQFGADGPVLLEVLTSEAKALRALGRWEEAAQAEKLVQSIRAANGRTGHFRSQRAAAGTKSLEE